MKQIFIEMGGRCGNQMFQYAFARALQKKYYNNYNIVSSYKNVENSGKKEEGWENSLQYFNIVNGKAEGKFNINLWQLSLCIVLKIWKKLNPDADVNMQRILNKSGIYASRKSYFFPVYGSKKKNIYIRGRFEAHEYFDFIREELLKEFTPKYDVLEHNKRMYSEIIASQSVCVTIRRGDFLHENNAQFNVCDKAYYLSAMNQIKKEVPNAKFFVFSDDIEDIKENFDFSEDVVYESGQDPIWEKMRLMYSCKHFIISNSTFSWWAQYLGTYDQKIVFAPRPWRKGNENCSGMYLEYMKYVK